MPSEHLEYVVAVGVVAGVVLLRLQPARFLVVLPAAVVPDGRLAALRT